MSFYSKLEAVNSMLLESGEHIVNDLSSTEGVDTSIAQFVLEQTIKSMITRGLANNRFETNIILSSTGQIYLPPNTVYAESMTPLRNSLGYFDRTTLKQGPNRLFNITQQTDVFLTALDVDIIINLEWEEIEGTLQKSIIATASRDYQRITQGSDTVDRALAEKEMKCNIKARATDIAKKRRTLNLNPYYLLPFVFRSPRVN